MARVLVTGGAGAIGSQLVGALLKRGDEVVVVDNFDSGFRELVPAAATFVEASITDDGAMETLFGQHAFAQVFHLAALFANQNSVDHPLEDLAVNGRGTLSMLMHAQAQHKRGTLRRFIYVSSSCVYGMSEGPVAETAPFHPETPYGITKLLGEEYGTYFAAMGLPVTTVRLFNSYGPGEKPGRYRNVIPNFFRLALRGEPLVITGTGDETRDFTYVEDVVEGILAAAQSAATIGNVYNLCTGQETKIRTLAEHIIRLTGGQSELRFAPRRGWDKTTRRQGDSGKARAHFGFHPRTRLEDGLVRTHEWLKTVEPKS